MLLPLSILIGILSSLLAFLLPIQHDYSQYAYQWQQYLVTGHPYIVDGAFNENAYGPLYIVLAYLYQLHPNVPRLLFVFCWIGISFFLVRLSTAHLSKKLAFFIWISLFLNPFFYVLTLIYGINEIVISALVIAGIYSLLKQKDNIAGLLFGAGILFKFIPFFLIPFLTITDKPIRWRYVITSLIVTAIGFMVSYLLWFKEILAPFMYAVERPSSFLSIFNFLKGNFSQLSFPLLIISLVLLFLLHRKYRFEVLDISLMVLVTTFSVLKVHHPQYQTTILLLMILWFIFHHKQIITDRILIISSLIYFVYFSLIPVPYIFLDRFTGQWQWIREIIGLPTFIVSMLFLIMLFRHSIRASHKV